LLCHLATLYFLFRHCLHEGTGFVQAVTQSQLLSPSQTTHLFIF
jgi:hypothetical protein